MEEFRHLDNQPYLVYPSNFCLSLNMDWFNPFKQTPYSAGGIYLTVQNLPRTECYKMENIILVGIMPGPQEPKKNINFFLKSLVDDLIKLYHGIKLENSNSIFKETTIRAILSCIICDMPATRKVCGFLSYHARFGCSKCLKEFTKDRFDSKQDFSGYNEFGLQGILNNTKGRLQKPWKPTMLQNKIR